MSSDLPTFRPESYINNPLQSIKAMQRQPEVPVQPPASRNATQTLHNTALFGLLAFPAIALLPPRKLDIFTFGLIGGTFLSANWLHRERYGRSILERLSGTGPKQVEMVSGASLSSAQKPVVVRQEIQGRLQPVKEQEWVTERRVEEKEAIEEGKGIFDMMGDQVKQVFAGDKNHEK